MFLQFLLSIDLLLVQSSELASSLKRTRDQDVLKGKAISRQLVRILFQLLFLYLNTRSRRVFGTLSLTRASVCKNALQRLTDSQRYVHSRFVF